MARKLPKRLVAKQPGEAVPEDDPLLQEARARHASVDINASGGAWGRAGAHVATQQLSKLQQERIDALRAGALVVELDPAQVQDEVGSDRNTDWDDDEAFEQLRASIEVNGQDVPIQVQPLDPDWQPVFDEANGLVLSGVRFAVIGGRRRLAVARTLDRSVKAVLVPSSKEMGFDQLHRRYRENVERENLSLFDELMSIGEMFSHEKTFGEKMTGRALAKRLSVSEPKVSKGRALYDNRERVFAEIDEPHLLTLHQLDAIIPALRSGDPLPAAEAESDDELSKKSMQTKAAVVTAPSVKRTQIINGKKIVARARRGKISLDLGPSSECDEKFLDRLLLFIQTELSK